MEGTTLSAQGDKHQPPAVLRSLSVGTATEENSDSPDLCNVVQPGSTDCRRPRSALDDIEVSPDAPAIRRDPDTIPASYLASIREKSIQDLDRRHDPISTEIEGIRQSHRLETAAESSFSVDEDGVGLPKHHQRLDSLAEGSTANACPEASEVSSFWCVPANATDDHADSTASGRSSQTATDEKDDSAHLNTAHEYWTSEWLRKRTLLALAALFVALAVALIVLWFTNNALGGYPTTLSSNHYAWTYGPTAVLVVVISFWRQVDYHCKVIQPWKELRNGPTDGTHSVLLDYLSPLQIISLIKAIRNRHTAVAASITGFAILKIVVLSSTGLLVLKPVPITERRDIVLSTAFDSEYFWDTLPQEDYILTNRLGAPVIYPNVSSHPVHSYLNTLAVDAGNLAGEEVFQTIQPLSVSGFQDISTRVQSFVPNINCEVADSTVVGPTTDYVFELYEYRKPHAQLNGTSCLGAEEMYFPVAMPLCKGPCPSVISYNLWKLNCSKDATLHSLQESVLNVDTPYDLRFAMLVSNLTFDTVLDNLTDTEARNASDYLPSIPVPHQSAAVVCKIDYSMHESDITKHFPDDSISINEVGPVQKMKGLTGMMLGHIIYSALARAQNVVGDLRLLNEPDDETDPSPLAPFYAILLQALEGRQSMDRFLSERILQSSVSHVWTGIAASVMREFFLKPVRHEATGTIVFIQDRLVVGAASLWIMVACLVLVAMLTWCIIVSMPPDIIPRDPGLLTTDAIVLTSSTSLHRLLQHCNDLRTSEIFTLLRGTKFQTDDRKAFQIIATRDTSIEGLGTLKSKAKGWVPLCAKRPMICFTLAVRWPRSSYWKYYTMSLRRMTAC